MIKVTVPLVFRAKLHVCNVMSGVSEPSVFIGIPIPAAAVVLTMWVLTPHPPLS